MTDIFARGQAAGAKRRALSSVGSQGSPSTNYTTPATLGSAGNVGGKRPVDKIGRDWSRLAWGQEYLFHWLTGVYAASAQTVALVGDSTTSGYIGTRLAALLAALPNITVTNYGVSGSSLDNWVNNTGVINGTGNHMAAVIAANPDLIVMGYGGINEPKFGRSPAQYAASLNSALTSIRAGANGNIGRCSIMLHTANAISNGGAMTIEGGFKPDEQFNFQVRQSIIDAADAFQCAFFDKNGTMPDAFVDFAAGSVGVDTWLDNNRVHPSTTHTNILVGAMLDLLYPSGLRPSPIVVTTNIAPATGFTSPGGVNNMATRVLNKTAILEGYLTGPSTVLASGRAIGTVTAPLMSKWNVPAKIYDGTLPMENSFAHINLAGAVTMEVATVKSCQQIYIDATYTIP